ncbi:DODA-type extradiol aromatic ring-opening family dioxygenase [Paenibacillus rigui]|uniref:Dioxygenase n=1 Tax=Paenibacillus rigui TaxID=554312 RepID=A0A229UK69_9BACL|nr:class III extradiol ring-cleavage dioxygenase [Paenibacillus rigui]OXM83299.1 dioxygenase [Paenibacillus rigui]
MYPTMFVAHGTPSLALENNAYTRFLRNVGILLPKPQAIVMISSHWEHSTVQISSAPQLETMYDFFGFPEPLYDITYPAKGNLPLSLDIQQLLGAEGIDCELNERRGLDHGAWSVLRFMYPEADVPVVALSFNPRLVPEEQYRFGRALMPLREKGILILCSGGTVHNLAKLQWETVGGEGWAMAFDRWLAEHIQVWDQEALFDYERRAPYVSDAVPTHEHLLPLFISMGAADVKRKARLLHQEYQYRTLSLAAWMFQ